MDRMKAEGTYLTKAQKERAKRAAILREQFGFQMEDGEEAEAGEGSTENAEGEQKPTQEKEKTGQKRPMATRIKKKKVEMKPVEEEAPLEEAAAAGKPEPAREEVPTSA